jgi:hypothetical protein
MDVLLSTDVGAEIDDHWAIAHLALSPRVNLLGIVTTHTPYLTAQRSAEIAQGVLNHLPLREKPPVVPGSSTPLESADKPQQNEGIAFILETARRYSPEKPLTLLTIGAADRCRFGPVVRPFDRAAGADGINGVSQRAERGARVQCAERPQSVAGDSGDFGAAHHRERGDVYPLSHPFA